jgi:hypothetical protein
MFIIFSILKNFSRILRAGGRGKSDSFAIASKKFKNKKFQQNPQPRRRKTFQQNPPPKLKAPPKIFLSKNSHKTLKPIPEAIKENFRHY